MHVLEISINLQNAEIYPVILLKRFPSIKILRTLTGNICNGVSFSMVIGGWTGQVE